MDLIALANEIINKHYSSGLLGYFDSLKHGELAAEAAQYPLTGRPNVAYAVLTQLQARGFASSDIVHVARGILDSIPQQNVNSLVLTPDGSILIRRIGQILKITDPGNATSPRSVKIKTALDLAKPKPKKPGENPYYTIDAGIVLEADAIAVLDKIGPLYFEKVGKKFNVNSGTRDAFRQADAMWIKYPRDKIFSEYPNRKLINEILESIRAAQKTGKDRAGIVQAMTNAIQLQINRKEYISKHLIAGCIDIATEPDIATGVARMSSQEQTIMKEIAVKVTGGTAKKENNPPHIHIQFK